MPNYNGIQIHISSNCSIATRQSLAGSFFPQTNEFILFGGITYDPTSRSLGDNMWNQTVQNANHAGSINSEEGLFFVLGRQLKGDLWQYNRTVNEWRVIQPGSSN